MTSLWDVAKAVRRVPFRALVRAPLELEASRILDGLPLLHLAEVSGPVSFEAVVSDSWVAWNLHTTDQIALKAIVLGRGARTAFEIGTFNGTTTRLLAETLPDDGWVVTLDLPPAQFDATQHAPGFTGSQVGEAYKASPAAGKITQLLQDSLSFDAGPYAGRCDVVLVDGAHDYVHGLADTATSLKLVAPGGVILFDDFEPYWHGLVRGIATAMHGNRLARIAGTPLGVYVSPSRRAQTSHGHQT